MIALRKTSSSDHRGKALKPSTRGLFQTMKRVTKTTNHAIRNKIPRRWSHVDLLMEFTIKKGIFDIKLRNGPSMNRGHNKESADSGHVFHRSKGLIIVTTMLLLKTTSNKTGLVMLERAIRASLDLIDPLACDRTSIRSERSKVPTAGALESSDLLSHGLLPFWMTKGIMVGGRLRKDSASKTIPIDRFQRATIAKIIT
jgi:hypothetical protein